jgi:molybdate transport system ATP-binding protein
MLQVQLQSQDPVYLDMAFECQNGQLLALVGPSGSGKTSALRAIAGLLPVASGKIGIGDTTWLDTENNLFIPPTKRSIGMVFQNYALFPHLTAYQNIELALPSHLTQEYVEGLLKDMGLMDLQKRYPHELSGGQRQRVALARAFARQPKVLLLDEAFSAVDHPTRKILYEELIKLRQRIEIPIVMVTHDLREARLLSDNMCILDQGKSLQQATPAHIFSSPRNERVAQLVGLSDIFSGTFFKKEQVDSETGVSIAHLKWGQGIHSVILEINDKGRLPNHTEVKWVISGEYVDLSLTKKREVNSFSASVSKILQLGDVSSLTLSIELPFPQMMHLEISTRMVRDLVLLEGKTIYLSLDPSGIHIMPVYSDPSVKIAQKKLREKPIQIGAVLLVAGQGSRLGDIPKSLMKIDGVTLLERHIETLNAFVTQAPIVVTGFYADSIHEKIKHKQVQWVHNPAAEAGQSSSVRLGLETLYQSNQSLDVILMMLGDQPFLNEADIRQLIENFKVRKLGQFLLPIVQGKRGNPVLLSGSALKKIIEKAPEMTVRQYMDQHPDEVIPWESANHHYIFDIDSFEDVIDFQNKTGFKIELPAKQ